MSDSKEKTKPEVVTPDENQNELEVEKNKSEPTLAEMIKASRSIYKKAYENKKK